MTICEACGYPNDDQDHRCEQCGRRFDEYEVSLPWRDAGDAVEPPATPLPPPAATVQTSSPPVVTQYDNSAQRLREEVSTRVQRFRQKRQAQAVLPLEFSAARAERVPASTAPEAPPPPPPPVVDMSRKVIPFQEIADARGVIIEEQQAPVVEEVPPPAPPAAPSSIPDSPVPSPQSHPAKADTARLTGSPSGVRNPHSQLPFSFPAVPPAEELACPVAPVPARLMAGMADAAVLACGYGLFFGAYTLMGGKFPLQRYALVSVAVSAAVVAIAYLVLALVCAAATPGMRWVGLQVVDFEGRPASRDRRALRLFGLCGSAAALGAGFLWAFVDEQKLTWHDRVSRTFLTGLSD